MARSSIGSWGPSAWTFMHTVSFAYAEQPTEEDRRVAFDFMHGFAAVLPCRRCRTDWQAYLRTRLSGPLSPALDSRGAFSRFVVEGHNYVNAKLGKPLVAYDTVRQWYLPGGGGDGAVQAPARRVERCVLAGLVGALTVGAIACLVVRSPAKQPAIRRRGAYPTG